MKKILTSLLIVFVISGLKAQDIDTLGYENFTDGTSFLYQSPNGGYAFGNNGYGDLAKAQTYSNDSAFVLREVLMIFGDVVFESGDPNSAVRVNLYDNKGLGITSVSSTDSVAPDSVLSFVDVPISQLFDDGSFTIADFTGQNIVLTNLFSVGIDFSMLSQGDTVGLLSTTDGDAGGTHNAWELTSSGTWFTVEESVVSWGLDVDFAIFPVIDETVPSGITHDDNLKWDFYPNPSSNLISLSLPYVDKWNISLVDILGQNVLVQVFTGDSFVLDLEDYSTGMYFISVSNKDYTSMKRLIIE